jgi:acyl-CoA thioesterase FadM
MASTEAGWPPSRYRTEGNAFVVRSMCVVHHRETFYGDPLIGRSWVSRFRREMLSTREVRIDGTDGAPVVVATQEWAHVSAALEPVRAPKTLSEAFPVEERASDLGATLPEVAHPTHQSLAPVTLEIWDVWADPLGHVNHFHGAELFAALDEERLAVEVEELEALSMSSFEWPRVTLTRRRSSPCFTPG